MGGFRGHSSYGDGAYPYLLIIRLGGLLNGEMIYPLTVLIRIRYALKSSTNTLNWGMHKVSCELFSIYWCLCKFIED